MHNTCVSNTATNTKESAMSSTTAIYIYSAEAGDMITIDLADEATWPESLDLAALRDEAGVHGDTDLIAMLDRLGL